MDLTYSQQQQKPGAMPCMAVASSPAGPVLAGLVFMVLF